MVVDIFLLSKQKFKKISESRIPLGLAKIFFDNISSIDIVLNQ